MSDVSDVSDVADFSDSIGLAASLTRARADALARVASFGDATRLARALDVVDRDADAAKKSADEDANSRASDADHAAGKKAAARLTDACVVALTVAAALADGLDKTRPVPSTPTFRRVSALVSSSRRAGPEHWRAAAELEAATATIESATIASSDSVCAFLLKRAGSIASSPATLTRVVGGADRAVAALSCAATFRRAGALATGATIHPVVSALTSAAAQIDASGEGAHAWALHALGAVAAHAGSGFHRRAATARELSFAILNAPEATRSPSATRTRAACGRLVNASVAAVGPELDFAGAAYTRSASLIAEIGGGEIEAKSSEGASVQTDTKSSACLHEAALFLQQLAVFAPRVASPARLVPRLRPVLASGQPALRRRRRHAETPVRTRRAPSP